VVLGKVPNKDLPKYYSSADCFALPTISEGLPKALLEAMACGCPVIATNVSGNPEVVNSRTGYLVPAKDSGALRDAIIEIMEDSAAAKKRARAGAELIRGEFTWKKAAKNYAVLYKKLAKK